MKLIILLLLLFSCATTENQTPVEPVKVKTQISETKSILEPEIPKYEIMDVCPNLGNLKEIPENKIHLVNGIKQINVKYRDSNKTELVPLDVAQNSINTLDTKDKYVDFKKYYSKFCYTYIPFAGQTKFSKDLAINIKQLKEKNKKLIEEKNKKDQEVEKLESQISELQKDLPKKKSAPTNTFLLTGEPNTKTEDEIFVYGLAVSQNNNAFEKGAILQKEFYVVNRKGLELPYGVFYVEGMLFIGEVKRETKNGRVVVLNYYSKTPIEEKLSKEDTQKVKVLNEKIKKLELKREKIKSELDEIIVKLQPLIIAEYEYSEVSDVTKSQIVKPSTTTGSVNTQSVTWSEFQGIMNWKDAKKKCSSIGMQLPTIEELNAAYAAKVTESWKTDGYLYWSSTNVSDDSAYVLGTLSGSNDPVNHSVNRYVRCWSLNR